MQRLVFSNMERMARPGRDSTLLIKLFVVEFLRNWQVLSPSTRQPTPKSSSLTHFVFGNDNIYFYYFHILSPSKTAYFFILFRFTHHFTMSVEECRALIEDILPAAYCIGGDEFCIVTNQPGKAVQSSTVEVALWVRLVDGTDERIVNMRLPTLNSFLIRLANMGTDYEDDYNGMRFKFADSKQATTPCGKTLPISNDG